MSEVKLRYLVPVGTRARLAVRWYDKATPCGDSRSLWHQAEGDTLGDTPNVHDDHIGGVPSEYPDDRWPTNCERCGAAALMPVPLVPCECGCGELARPDGTKLDRYIQRSMLWGTPDGTHVSESFEPGDCYYATWYACAGGTCVWGWTNCDNRHLIVILPNRDPWDTNGRASNCTKRDDTTHRCWCVHGDPNKGELITIDKSGETCNAGAGSIQSGGYHGMLTNGILRVC